jgi:hypothetical protein
MEEILLAGKNLQSIQHKLAKGIAKKPMIRVIRR